MRFSKIPQRFCIRCLLAFPPQHRKGRNSKKPLMLDFSGDSALPFRRFYLFILRRNGVRGPRGPQFCEFARKTPRRSVGSKAVEICPRPRRSRLSTHSQQLFPSSLLLTSYDIMAMRKVGGTMSDHFVSNNEFMFHLASSKSTQISLQDIHAGRAGLNAHRQSMLDRVPNTGDYAPFQPDSLDPKDLAFLTAKTGHEFAILRGKREDILLHGTSLGCRFTGDLENQLKSHQLRIIAHSHPAEPFPKASPQDRAMLQIIGQDKSLVVSGMTGIIIEYSADAFEL